MIEPYILTQIDEYSYILNVAGEHKNYIYNTVEKIIKSSHIDEETNSLFFIAENIVSLKKYLSEQPDKKLSYRTCIKLISDLTKQLLYLEKQGYSFYGFDIDDIIIIDGIFIFVTSRYLLPIYDNNIYFYSLINIPYFSSPELLKLTTLPSSINYKSCYYSLGTLVVFCLLNNYLLVGNDIKTSEEIETIIEPLNNTKLYWFIKRCLNEETLNRTLLLI
jgi:hypothetical protein